jgi:hypothetical protein
VTSDGPVVSAPPREATPRARSAARRDPRVRFWWVLTGVLLVIAAYFLIVQTLRWWDRAWLVRSGVAVNATIEGAGPVGGAFETLPGRSPPPPVNVELSFDWHGQEQRVRRTLEHRVTTGDTMPIRVHPDNPAIWTDEQEVPPLLRQLIAPMILLPAVLIVAAVGWLMHRRILGVWREGEVTGAIVVETRQSAIAPLSQQVRCTPAAGGDRRLISVFVPNRLGRLQKGDPIRLIVSPRSFSLAIPVSNFASEEA